MSTLRTISAAVIGTSAMTLYSYLLAAAKQKNFSEPKNLVILLRRLYPVGKKDAEIICWTAHYTVGLIFVLAYQKVFAATRLRAGLGSGLALGFLTGLFAILVWNAVFNLHPRPPEKDFKSYYGQLLIAHIIFGICSNATLRRSLR